MTVSLAELNTLPARDAEAHFRACCGSSRWVAAMATRRPFENLEALLAAGDEVWRNTAPADWEEAFACHPRIGQAEAVGGSTEADSWSVKEQSAAARGDAATRAALAEASARYENRFGRIYIVCAAGRTAAELLANLEARLPNDPERERAVAAEEQRRITRLRLEKLVSHRKNPEPWPE